MGIFKVFHPADGKVNLLFSNSDIPYVHVIDVNVPRIEDVFKACQNDFSDEYASLGKRSTFIGDIILDVEDNTLYSIARQGFSVINDTEKFYTINQQYQANELTKTVLPEKRG